jgi:hypothetical protein
MGRGKGKKDTEEFERRERVGGKGKLKRSFLISFTSGNSRAAAAAIT